LRVREIRSLRYPAPW